MFKGSLELTAVSLGLLENLRKMELLVILVPEVQVGGAMRRALLLLLPRLAVLQVQGLLLLMLQPTLQQPQGLPLLMEISLY